MTELFGGDRFDVLPHLTALLIAYLLAVPIGWNREREDRSAGLRTFPLVAIAACGFIQSVESVMSDNPEAMSKVIEGLITGIGFIGGGAILKMGTTVHGTATAASLWVTGAIGTAVGLGQYDIAVILSAVTFLSFLVLRPIKKITGTDDGPVEDGRVDQSQPGLGVGAEAGMQR